MTTVTLPEPLEDRSPSAPQTSAPPEPRSLGRWAGRIGRFLAYGFLAMVLGAVGFSLVLGLLSAGISTVVVWIGLPILVAGVLVAHGFARAERALQPAILGTHLPTPAPVRPSAGAGRVRRLLTPLTDPQNWMDSLWVLVNFLLALVTFPLALAWTVGAMATVGGPVATFILDRTLPPAEGSGISGLLGVPEPYALPVDMVLQCLVGLLFLLTLGPVIRGLTLLHQGVARGLLSSRYQEQQRLARTEQSRAAGRSAESAALRRLERDLHDGPQQRLVRASMDLARVESLSERDPSAARTVLRETREQLGLTLDDLRRLSRGIAPPILVDRGLAAALTELAAISPLPATVECPEMSLPEHVEIGIYYVVSESLTNAAKHSGAGSVRVEVARSGDDARVRITDGGRGGAEMRTGGGLAGLAGRIASLEGRLTVTSPPAQGTCIEAVIPCAS
ncbi:sensor histidine kinase [Brachybacterium saurashtrense]|uniref:histidine kinase n=1 Tax=Brachybacterium saurashtrense TaxID=556288 RepID=A0A345YLC6_9MICO|nr:sensor histidine kinase [Brachybacterium saurashtrense]AXK44728.1 sensor histidine kinase [Brachybacterium saurashtrense]RRR23340.1 sensor histidine kinase [Brachybacterium saurashtrense]